MKAIVIRAPGGPEVLEARELPTPEPAPGQVRVRVSHAGVNRADLLQRAGLYPAPPGVPADVPGLEYAGVVDALGAGVTRLAVGDRVFGLVGGGAYAELLVVHEREVAKLPAAVSMLDAAASAEALVTAYDAMVSQAGLRPGERVLVHAAGSGVGTAAVQLAHALGCFVVGTSRTPEKLERCRALGLDAGVVAASGKFAAAVREATFGEGVDVVLDLVGGAYVPDTLEACAPGARVMLVGLTAGRTASVDLGAVLRKRLTVKGTVLRSRALEEKIVAAQALEKNLAPLLASGRVRAIVDHELALAEAARAHELVASDATFGKVVLRAG